jgi:hypothetical protein
MSTLTFLSLSTQSKGPIVQCGSSAMLANSYPGDMNRALASEDATVYQVTVYDRNEKHIAALVAKGATGAGRITRHGRL